ncbi:hypothetical protein [Ensifer aridi]|uniref:hypothetical protein n=1 Tax=Ensifer aridi TaxID=1708715 RepID=UPI00111BF9DE|nr:hypothetical protein [Ensifer aridi]
MTYINAAIAILGLLVAIAAIGTSLEGRNWRFVWLAGKDLATVFPQVLHTFPTLTPSLSPELATQARLSNPADAIFERKH